MKNEYLKTLWMLRFDKMRKNEEQAAWAYQEILDECLKHLPKDEEVTQLFSQLVHEERSHAKLAEELIRICNRNHPEFGVMAP